MTKQKILLLIPLLIIASLLIYTWSCIFFEAYYVSWQHVAGTVLFIIPIIMFFSNFKASILTMGCYLLLGTFNLLAFTPWIESTSYWMKIGPLELGTPKLQLFSFLLLILFCALNFKTLVNIYLDYKGYKDEQSTDKL